MCFGKGMGCQSMWLGRTKHRCDGCKVGRQRKTKAQGWRRRNLERTRKQRVGGGESSLPPKIKKKTHLQLLEARLSEYGDDSIVSRNMTTVEYGLEKGGRVGVVVCCERKKASRMWFSEVQGWANGDWIGGGRVRKGTDGEEKSGGAPQKGCFLVNRRGVSSLLQSVLSLVVEWAGGRGQWAMGRGWMHAMH